MWYSVVYISLQINTLLCYTVVSVLGIGIRVRTIPNKAPNIQ